MAAQHKGVHVFHAAIKFPREESRKTRRVQNARHANDFVVRQAGKLAQSPNHRVQGIGDADHEGLGAIVLNAFANRLHHFQIDTEQIIAAHPRLARHASGYDHNVSASDIGIVVRAGDLCVKPFDRAALRKVERFSLRHTLGNVEQYDVAHFLLRCEVGERAANHARADQRDLFASGLSHRGMCPLSLVLRDAVELRCSSAFPLRPQGFDSAHIPRWV